MDTREDIVYFDTGALKGHLLLLMPTQQPKMSKFLLAPIEMNTCTCIHVSSLRTTCFCELH